MFALREAFGPVWPLRIDPMRYGRWRRLFNLGGKWRACSNTWKTRKRTGKHGNVRKSLKDPFSYQYVHYFFRRYTRKHFLGGPRISFSANHISGRIAGLHGTHQDL